MQRFVCVRGVPGHLCGHPNQGDGVRRFVGKRQLGREARLKRIDELGGAVGQGDLYEDCAEVIALDDTIRKAIADQGLEQLGKVFRAPKRAAAVEHFKRHLSAPEPPKAASKAPPKKAAKAGGDD